MGQNLQILADGNRSLTMRYIVGNSEDRDKQYGAIQNMRAQVWRSSPRKDEANLAALKDVMRGRPNPAVPSFSTTQPAKAPRSDSHEDNRTGSQRTQNPSHLSLSTKRKAHNEAKPENKSQPLKKTVKTTTNKLHGSKREPSDIFKSFSNPKLKSDPRGSNSSAQTACEVGDPQSVREKVISGHSYHTHDLTGGL